MGEKEFKQKIEEVKKRREYIMKKDELIISDFLKFTDSEINPYRKFIALHVKLFLPIKELSNTAFKLIEIEDHHSLGVLYRVMIEQLFRYLYVTKIFSKDKNPKIVNTYLQCLSLKEAYETWSYIKYEADLINDKKISRKLDFLELNEDGSLKKEKITFEDYKKRCKKFKLREIVKFFIQIKPKNKKENKAIISLYKDYVRFSSFVHTGAARITSRENITKNNRKIIRKEVIYILKQINVVDAASSIGFTRALIAVNQENKEYYNKIMKSYLVEG